MKQTINHFILYMLTIFLVVPFFNNNAGITIGELKLGLSDLILGIFLLVEILRFDSSHTLKIKISSPFFYFGIIILLYILMIPAGIINGGTFPEDIKLIRNLLYVPLCYLIFSKLGKGLNYDWFLAIVGLISSISIIKDVSTSYSSFDTFYFDRPNSWVNMFIFCYLMFRLFEIHSFWKKVVIIMAELFLLIAIFLSQERTQIVVVILSVVITSMFLFFKRKNMHKKNLKQMINHVSLMFFIFLSVCILIYYASNNEFLSNYISHFYEYRLQNGELFQNLSSDSSFDARKYQIYQIFSLNNNLFSFLMGSGTNANYIAAQGVTYIVDGAFLWTFKDLGIVGMALLFIFCIKILSIKNQKNFGPLFGGGLTLFIFLFSNPSLLYNSVAAFTFGLFLYLRENLN